MVVSEFIQSLYLLSSEKRLANCNIVVTFHYVDKIRDFPNGLFPYVPADKFKEKGASPEFYAKIELARFLIEDALKKGIQFKEALFYSC